MENCGDLWHRTLSIREDCPACGGTARDDDGNILGLAVAADVALEVIDAVSDAVSDSDNDD